MIVGRILDASTLVGFALVRPYPQALVWTAVEEGMVLVIPAAALAIAWARTPIEAHDALAVLLDLPNTVIEPLDAAEAARVGQILAAAQHRDDNIDADGVRAGQVVVSALRRGWPIVSGEPAALRTLDARVQLDELP